MSGYTIGEIVVWLVLAAVLGFALGWLLRRQRCEREHGAVGPTAAVPVKAAALSGGVESAGPVNAGKNGRAPTADYTIKGNRDSMYFHTPGSPSYEQTIAEVWFKSEAEARAAGFTPPGSAGSTVAAPAKKVSTPTPGATKVPVKAAAKKAPVKSPAKKAPARSAATKAAAKKAPAKATATKATATKAAAKKAPAKATATKTAAKKAPAKATATKAAAKKTPAKSTATKAAAKKSPAKSTVTKAAAKKAPAKKAPVQNVAPGRFAGSAQPLSGGRAPSADYRIKGNEDSMIYHTPDSPFYGQTIAETWFKTEAAAVKAGFRKPRNA